MRIHWLAAAIHDLKSLREYIAADDPAAASRVADLIIRAVRVLENFPAGGRVGRVGATRELVVAGSSYVMIYRVRGEDIDILRVLHGAQKWPERGR